MKLSEPIEFHPSEEELQMLIEQGEHSFFSLSVGETIFHAFRHPQLNNRLMTFSAYADDEQDPRTLAINIQIPRQNRVANFCRKILHQEQHALGSVVIIEEPALPQHK